jgi:hypothetical protein
VVVAAVDQKGQAHRHLPTAGWRWGLLLILLYGGPGTGACDTLTVNGQVVQDTCAHGARYLWQVTLAVVLLVVFLVLPIVTVAYLGRRLRRASAEPVRGVPQATLPET